MVKHSSITIILITAILSVCRLNAQQIPQLVIPVNHATKVNKLAFGSEGRRLISIGGDRYLKLWDVASGRLLKTVRHDDGISAARYSNDGKKIVTASYDRTIKIWDENARLIRTLKGHNAVVFDVCFSKDSRRILSASADSTVKLWDAESGKLLKTFTGHNAEVKSAAFSQTESYIISTSFDSSAIAWNLFEGKMMQRFTGHRGLVNKGFMLEDFDLVITSGSDTTVKAWKLSTGDFIDNFAKSKIGLNDVKLSPDGLKIAAATSSLAIFNLSSGKASWPDELRRNIISVDFNAGSNLLAVASADSNVYIWDVVFNRLVRSFKTGGRPGTVIFGNNDRLLATITDDQTIRIWDAASGVLLQEMITVKNAMVTDILMGEGAEYFYVVNDAGIINKWHNQSLQLVKGFKPHKKSTNSVALSKDKKFIITASSDSTIVYWDAKTLKPSRSFRSANGRVYAARESSSGKYLLEEEYNTYFIRDAVKGTVLSTFPQKDIEQCVLLNNTDRLLMINNQGTIFIRDILGVGQTDTFITGHAKPTKIVLSADDHKLLIFSKCGATSVWDIPSKKMQCFLELSCLDWLGNNFSFTGSGDTVELLLNGYITTSLGSTFTKGELSNTAYEDYFLASFDANTGKLIKSEKIEGYFMCRVPGTNHLITAQYDLTLRKKDLASGKTIADFFGLNNETYLIQTSDGYYQTTANATRYIHYVNDGLKIFNPGTADLQFNRPDLVQRSINNPDSNYIKGLEKASLKRIAREGLKPAYFSGTGLISGPSVKFPGIDAAKTIQNDGWLFLRIRAVDSTYNISKIDITVNAVPVYGSRGHRLSGNQKILDTALYIQLAPGKNSIEFSAGNSVGMKSSSEIFSVYYQPLTGEVPVSKTFFIGIGIDEFKDSKNNLRYSVKDIKDIAALLKKKNKAVEIDTLFNKNVTRENIIALKKKLLSTTIHDKVIIAYSGHGILSNGMDYYLSTYEVDFNEPSGKGISYDDFEWLIDSIPARNKAMLIDACHSGELDKEEGFAANVKNQPSATARGVKPLHSQRNTYKGYSSFELMNKVFSYSGKSPGGFIFAAASGQQFALENTSLQNGVFTYCILDFLNNYPAAKTINALAGFVSGKVMLLTGGTQQPVSRTGDLLHDWTVLD